MRTGILQTRPCFHSRDFGWYELVILSSGSWAGPGFKWSGKENCQNIARQVFNRGHSSKNWFFSLTVFPHGSHCFLIFLIWGRILWSPETWKKEAKKWHREPYLLQRLNLLPEPKPSFLNGDEKPNCTFCPFVPHAIITKYLGTVLHFLPPQDLLYSAVMFCWTPKESIKL